MSYYGCPAMKLGHGTQIDGECEDHLLALTQPQVRRLDKYAGGTEIDGFAQLPAAARDGDIDDSSSTVPRVQAAFHLIEPRVVLVVLRRDATIMQVYGRTAGTTQLNCV
jgi:hypothetical protein